MYIIGKINDTNTENDLKTVWDFLINTAIDCLKKEKEGTNLGISNFYISGKGWLLRTDSGSCPIFIKISSKELFTRENWIFLYSN